MKKVTFSTENEEADRNNQTKKQTSVEAEMTCMEESQDLNKEKT